MYRTGRALSETTRDDVLSLYDAMVLGANTGATEAEVPADDGTACESSGKCLSLLHASERAGAKRLVSASDRGSGSAWSGGRTPRAVLAAQRDDLAAALSLASSASVDALAAGCDPAVAEAAAAAALPRAVAKPWSLAQGRARVVAIAFGCGDEEGALLAVGPPAGAAHGEEGGEKMEDGQGEDEDEDAGEEDEDEDEDEHGSRQSDEDGSEAGASADEDEDEDEDGDAEEDDDDEPAPLLDPEALAALHEKETRVTFSLRRPLAALAWKSGIERVC